MGVPDSVKEDAIAKQHLRPTIPACESWFSRLIAQCWSAVSDHMCFVFPPSFLNDEKKEPASRPSFDQAVSEIADQSRDIGVEVYAPTPIARAEFPLVRKDDSREQLLSPLSLSSSRQSIAFRASMLSPNAANSVCRVLRRVALSSPAVALATTCNAGPGDTV